MKKSFIKRVLCAVLSVILCLSFPYTVYGVNYRYSIFINDQPWYNQSQYPLETFFNLSYLPITAFTKLDGVTVSENKNLNNVMLSNGDNNYITFDLETLFAYCSDGTQPYVITYTLHGGELYVPVDFVCDYFGFNFESVQNGKIIRISNSEDVMGFHELLEMYVISEETGGDSFEGDDTPGSYTPENPNVYLIFDNCPNENTEEILKLLDKSGIKAAFFVTEEGINLYPETILKIAAGGHSIGIYLESYDEENSFGIINSANEKLRALTKHKSRLIRIGTEQYNTSEDVFSVYKEMYSLCGYNVDIGLFSGSSAEILQTMLENINKNQNTVFRFSENENSLSVLNDFLIYIDQMQTDKYNFIAASD